MKLSKNKKIIVSIISVIVVLITALIVAYFTTDLLKTPKQLFFKYLGKQVDVKSYEQLLKGLETDKTKSYTSNTNLKINIEAEDEEEIYNTINKMNLNLEQSVNPKENAVYDKLNLKYDDKDLATLELVQNDKLYAAKSEYLDGDKYVAIENKDLKSFLRNMGVDDEIIENVPDQITDLDLYELLYISKKDQKSIMKTYKKFIDENISKDKFKVNNKVDITLNGENKKATQYKLTLNEKEVIDIAINFMNTLKQDDVTLDLIIEKYNKCMEDTITGISMYQTKEKLSSYGLESKNNGEKTLTKEKLKEYIDEEIEEIEDEKEDAKEDSTIDISLYKIKEKICRMEIIKDKKSIKVDKYESNGRNYIETVASRNKYSYNKGRRETVKTEDKVIVDYTLKKQNNEMNIEGNIKSLEDSEEEGNFKFNINQKGKVYNENSETNIEISSTIEENTIKVNLNNKKEYRNIDIIKLSDNKDNMSLLNEMTKEDIETLFEKISKNFQTKLNNKINELGLGNSKIKSDIEEIEDTDEDIEWEMKLNNTEDINWETEDFEY